MGDSSQHTQSTSATAPWRPTQHGLADIIHGITGMLDNKGYMPNQNEQDALAQIMKNAQGLPNYGPQSQKMTDNFMSGDPFGYLKSGYGAYKDALTPLATQSLDPTQTPGMGNLLDTIRSDVSNNVNGMFAGAGRDMSGMNVQALGRGISQGEAAPLLAQYNQNVAQRMGAANGLLGAAGATSTAMGMNQQTGLNMAKNLPSMYNIGPQAILAASQASRGLPISNMAQLESLLLPIAQLGQQGKSDSWSTYSPSAMSQIQQGLQIGGTVAGMGGSVAGMPMMSGGFNPFGGFTGNYFPQNQAAQGATPQYFGGQYFPMFGQPQAQG